jgi:hypothetical protein
MAALGPYYNYSDELKYPSEIPLRRDGDIFSGPGAIEKNVIGVQYYVNAMATGTSVGAVANYSDMAQSPMGLNYFIDTGLQCSNGASMNQYISTIPTGLPGATGAKLKVAVGGNLQGLAPGVLQDTINALNPMPYFNAAIGTGFPKCTLMEAPVGNVNGELKSRFGKPVDKYGTMVPNIWVDPTTEKVYYKTLPPGDGTKYVPSGPQPFVRRWVFDKWISQDEYKWTQEQLKKMGRFYSPSFVPDQNTPPDPPIPAPPTANQIHNLLFGGAGVLDPQRGVEGFAHNRRRSNERLVAGVLSIGLVAGLVALTMMRK